MGEKGEMASEDELMMQDATDDGESFDDDFYSGGDAHDSDEDDVMDYDFNDNESDDDSDTLLAHNRSQVHTLNII